MMFDSWFRDEIVPQLRTAEKMPGKNGMRTFILPSAVVLSIVEHAPLERRNVVDGWKISPSGESLSGIILHFPGDKASYLVAARMAQIPGMLDEAWNGE